MVDIKIYGEIVPFQDPWVTDYGYYNLSALQRELAEAAGAPVNIRINSPGGDVNEGFAIYSELRRYASKHNVEITTMTDGHCASIATVFFLAGDRRILNQYIEPFVHNAYTYEQGDANTFKKTLDVLERTNNKIAAFYADHTNLTLEEAKELMNLSSYITPEEAVGMRFATEIEDLIRPAALLKYNPKNKNEMAEITFTKEHDTLLNRLSKFLGGIKSPENLKVYTSANVALDFTEIEEESEIKVGAKVLVDGEETSGSYLMNSKETYVIEKGKLSEIIPAEDEGEDEVENLKNQLAEAVEAKSKLQNLLDAKNTELETTTSELTAAKAEIESSISILNKLKGIEPGENPDFEPGTPPTPPTTKNKSDYSKAISNIKI